MSVGMRLTVDGDRAAGMMVRFQRGWASARYAAAQAILDDLEANMRVTVVESFVDKSGELADSWIRDTVVEAGRTLKIRLHSAAKHAAIQHYGGTVYPKTVSRLAIPLRDDLRRQRMWPRDYPMGKFFATAPTGPAALMDRATKVHWYALVESVAIPGTRYVTKALEKTRRGIAPNVRRALRDASGQGS